MWRRAWSVAAGVARRAVRGEDLGRAVAACRRLGPFDPLRQAAEGIHLGRPADGSLAGVLLTALNDPAPRARARRAAACWIAGRTRFVVETDRLAVIRALCDVLEERTAEDRMGRAIWRSWCVALVCGLPTATLACVARIMGGGARLGALDLLWQAAVIFLTSVLLVLPVAFLLITLSLPVVVPFSLMADKLRARAERAEAAESLGLLRAREGVPALLRAAFDLTPGVRAAAEAALLRALPALGPDQYGAVAPDVTPNLVGLLGRAEPLALAALEALEKVGDGRALAAAEAACRGGRSPTVRAAAAALVPLLRERARRERAPWSLLRAAHPESPASLVRPARSAGSEVEALVRPAEVRPGIV